MNKLFLWIGKQFVITAVILYCLHNYLPSLFPTISLGCGTGYSNASYLPTSYRDTRRVSIEPLGGLDE